MPLLYSVLAFFLTLGLLALELFIPSADCWVLRPQRLSSAPSFSASCTVWVPCRRDYICRSGHSNIDLDWLRIWPRTAIGRMMLNIDPSESGDPLEQLRMEREQWIGKPGIALTDMLPSGIVELEGRRWDAVSNGVAIDKGEAVEVCDYTAGRIQVKKRAVKTGASFQLASRRFTTGVRVCWKRQLMNSRRRAIRWIRTSSVTGQKFLRRCSCRFGMATRLWPADHLIYGTIRRRHPRPRRRSVITFKNHNKDSTSICLLKLKFRQERFG